LKLTYDSIKAGASGVDMGRNIWQSDNPIAMIRAVRSVVHEGYDIDQAYEKLLNLQKVGIPNLYAGNAVYSSSA
jgi:3-hydroxy-5-phosphonooxypentane-2,4-dione thiolase